MNSAASIRPATVEDVAAIATFATQIFSATFGPDNRPEDMQEYLATAFTPENSRRQIAEASGVFLLAEDDRGLAGIARLRVGPAPDCLPDSGTALDAIEIERLYVAQRCHGVGVAQQLMAALCAEAAALGYGRVWLGVWEDNPRAIAFYRKSGFVDVGSKPFTLGSELQNDRVMVALL